MLVLKRVCEDRNHIDNLRNLLKFYSKNPENWSKEWSVNPYYMVDLKQYGAGYCVCGHPIRYQFQLINTVTNKTFPVGSVCVHLLQLSSFNETVDKLERINQMATQDLEDSLDDESFVKKYRKFYNPENIDALMDYGKLKIDPYMLSIYKTYFTKRKLSDNVAEKMRFVIEELAKESKDFISGIESKSKPVMPDQVQEIVDDSASEMLRFAKAKQNKLPF